MRTPPREDEPFRRRASRDCRPLPPPFPPSAARAFSAARAASSTSSAANSASLRVTPMGPLRIQERSRERPNQGLLGYGAT